MTKQEQFLYIVQTAILANGTNMASDPETRDRFRHEASAIGTMMLAEEAIRASELIPADMSAADAAGDFCGHMFTNLREEGQNVPWWFAR